MQTPTDPETVTALRDQFRCARCNKRCLIPCQFTAAEFRELVDEVGPDRDAPPPTRNDSR